MKFLKFLQHLKGERSNHITRIQHVKISEQVKFVIVIFTTILEDLKSHFRSCRSDSIKANNLF